MDFFEWTSQLDLGIDRMNVEHKMIISLMNRLHELNEKDASHEELLTAIDRLAEYTVVHFREEEAYMASITFPGLDTHKILHAKLVKQLGEHRQKFVEAGGKVPAPFFDFLKFWLLSHIRGIDMKYGEFSQSVNSAA